MKREVLDSLLDELKEREFELYEAAEVLNEISAYDATVQAVKQNAGNPKRLEQWTRIAAKRKQSLTNVLESYKLEHYLDEIN